MNAQIRQWFGTVGWFVQLEVAIFARKVIFLLSIIWQSLTINFVKNLGQPNTSLLISGSLMPMLSYNSQILDTCVQDPEGGDKTGHVKVLHHNLLWSSGIGNISTVDPYIQDTQPEKLPVQR